MTSQENTMTALVTDATLQAVSETPEVAPTESVALGKMDYVPDAGWEFDLTFDFESATYSVVERHESDNMSSFWSHYGHSRTYVLPSYADASKFADWIAEDVQPLLDRIKTGYSTDWKNGNEVAVLSEDAAEAREELDEMMFGDNNMPLLEDGGAADASDYLYEWRGETIAQYQITKETSDEDISRIADELNCESLAQCVRLSGTYDFVLGLRDSLAGEEAEG